MPPSMRILILTHHYPPEVGAPQTRLSGIAGFLRWRGHEVSVVTSMPSYPTGVIPSEYRNRWLWHGWRDGVRVVRTPTFARPNPGIRYRLANQLSFAASAPTALPFIRRPDVILVESPPLFVGATAALFGALLHAPIVLHVSDLWPAIPIQLGALRGRATIRAAELFERLVYRLSRRLIVVTESWVDHLLKAGVSRDKISVVTNGVDTDFLDPTGAAHDRARERSALALDDKLVISCIGTVSTVYDYELLLDAANRLRDRDDLRFLIVGGGSLSDDVRASVARRRLDNVVILPAQSRERVRALLAASDIALVALRPLPVTNGQLPVRILEAMAMELPVIAAGTGESRAVVERAGAGIAVTQGSADDLVEAIARLADGQEMRHDMGTRGRRTIEASYSRATVAGRIEGVLRSAATIASRRTA
jgi:glycosyltransferase involved in cell wall biosynthesis